jgi:hypothetical protein
MPGGQGKEPHCKAMTVLAAPTVFYGNIMPYLERIELNHEYFIAAKKFELATREFGNQIIRNLFDFKNGDHCIIDGVYVVQAPKIRGSEGEARLWTHHEIQTGRSSFLRNAKEAVVGRREIYADAIVWLSLGAAHGFELAAAKRAASAMPDAGEKKDKKKKAGKNGILGKSLLARAAAKSAAAKEAERKKDEQKMAQGSFYRLRKRFMFHWKDANAEGDDAPGKGKGAKKPKRKSSSAGKGGKSGKVDSDDAPGSEYDPRVGYPARSTAMGLFEKREDAEFYSNTFGAKKPQDPEFNRMIKTLRTTIVDDIATRYRNGDWVACYERLLIIIVWNDGHEHSFVSQIFNSMVGQMRQLSIEAQILRDVLSQCVRSSESSGKFNSLLLKQYASFFKRVSKLIGGASAHASLVGTSNMGTGSRSSILASLKLIMRAKLGMTVDDHTKRLRLEKISVNCMDSMSRTFRVIELSVAADAIPVLGAVPSAFSILYSFL